jgi:hypothetical protein
MYVPTENQRKPSVIYKYVSIGDQMLANAISMCMYL